MRRYWVLALAVLILLGVASVPAFAAEKPKPKVTITGYLGFFTSWSQNMSDRFEAVKDFTNDEEIWYSRQRGVVQIVGQVGKVKATYRFEMDFMNGASTDGGLGRGMNLGTDEKEQIEVTDLNLQFPLTGGPGSLLPFIQVPTTAKVGGQSFHGHDFKRVIAVDRFGGLDFTTTFAPNVKNIFTFVQDEEGRIGHLTSEPDSYAIIESLVFTPQKGLEIKPTFAFWDDENGEGGNRPVAFEQASIGVDAEWKSGPYVIEPTFHFQWGEENVRGGRDISTWIWDVIGSWRSGPMKLSGRFVWTPGDSPEDSATDDIDSWRVIWNSGTYYAGWTDIFTTGVDFYRTINSAGANIGWVNPKDGINHGRVGFTGKVDYSVTPAVTLTGMVHPFWTDEEVDTDLDGDGDENFIGTELVAQLKWRFAPNIFLWQSYSHLFAASALDQCPGTTTCASPSDAEDVDLLSTRIQYTF